MSNPLCRAKIDFSEGIQDCNKGLEDVTSRQFGQYKYWGSGGLVGRFAPHSRFDVWLRDLSYGDDDTDHDVVFFCIFCMYNKLFRK